MARTQVDSSVRAEALQTVATQQVQGAVVQADPRSNKAFALAEALGVAQPKIETAYNASVKKAEEDAVAYAGSLSAEELGNKIKNGEMPNFKSPVFIAQVKRIHGENQVSSVATRVSEDIKNGNVLFNSDAELDQYINAEREKVLSGADRFMVAGFDSKLNDFKNQIRKQNTSLLSKRTADEAEAVVFQNFKEIYEYSKNDETVTAEDRIALMNSRYAAYRRDGILPTPEKQREMLVNIARVAAENKDKEFLDKFLKSSLEGGMSVERVLGPDGLDKINSAIDKIQTSQYYRKQREKSEAMESFTDEIEARLTEGKDIKDILNNEEKYSVLSQSQRNSLANRIKKNLAEGGTFTLAHLQDIAQQFSGITDPQQATFLHQTLLQRAGSKEERAAINETYRKGKFDNPNSDPAYSYGRAVVQSLHNSTDNFIGSNSFGPANIKYMEDWGKTFYTDGKTLYAQHKDVIPEEYKDRQMSQLPIQVKRDIAKKIAQSGSNQFEIKLPTNTGNQNLSVTARPANPGSNRVLEPGESIRQNNIVIKVEKDK